MNDKSNRLLLPENFTEWRKTYPCGPHQMAWFHDWAEMKECPISLLMLTPPRYGGYFLDALAEETDDE